MNKNKNTFVNKKQWFCKTKPRVHTGICLWLLYISREQHIAETISTAYSSCHPCMRVPVQCDCVSWPCDLLKCGRSGVLGPTLGCVHTCPLRRLPREGSWSSLWRMRDLEKQRWAIPADASETFQWQASAHCQMGGTRATWTSLPSRAARCQHWHECTPQDQSMNRLDEPRPYRYHKQSQRNQMAVVLGHCVLQGFVTGQ